MNLQKLATKYRSIIRERDPHVTTAHTDKGHFYVSPTTGEQLHSVTFYTSVIKDPSLALWRMNRALEAVEQAIYKDDIRITSKVNLQELFEEAKAAPESEFSNAGDIGTQTHAWREQFFKAWIESGKGSLTPEEIDSIPLPADAAPEVISGCRAIKKFLKDTGAIPIACELALVDDELKVGGMFDDLFLMPNPVKVAGRFEENGDPIFTGGYTIKYKPYLAFCDLKTSSQGKKPAYCFQVRGFYQRMFRKIFRLRPKKTFILHTSKENGTYQLIDLTDMKFLERDVKILVELARSWDKVVAALKPKVITI